MNRYRDNYYGTILDPLHGDIKLSEIEKWCLAQPIFYRLRYVRQNTFLYYVFPSANHSRFEHSIGVMHISGRIFDACKENYATGEKKREKYNQPKDSFFDLSNLDIKEPLYYQELRLAALLHDIGHGPMSHLFDEFSVSVDKFREIVDEDCTLSIYKEGFEKWISDEGKIEHEMLSCAFAFNLIGKLKACAQNDANKFSSSASQLIKELSAQRIVRLISPAFTGLSDHFNDDKGNNYNSFFSKIITAFPIDADRMDYLIRDSYFSGVTYGIYDLNRIYASFQSKCEDNKVELVLKESGLDSILRFIQSRTHLYNQVYFHKTNRAVNTMLSYATRNLRTKSVKLLDAVKNLSELEDFYIENSDVSFIKHTIFKQTNGVEKEVLEELIARKLFKRVYERKLVFNANDGSTEEGIKNLKSLNKKMEAKLRSLESSGICAVIDFYKNDTFKDSGDKAIQLARKRRGSKDYEFFGNWPEVNLEFKMSNMIVVVVRVYLRRSFHSSEQFKNMSKKVLDEIAVEIEKLEE